MSRVVVDTSIKDYEMISRLVFSPAANWQELANDLTMAVARLEATGSNAKFVSMNQAIQIDVAEDCQSLSLSLCGPNSAQSGISDAELRIHFSLLPAITDALRDDGWTPPNGSIDRAISKVAADMLSWTKDPETFEVIEHRDYFFFIRWPGRQPVPVNEYAYGLWDE